MALRSGALASRLKTWKPLLRDREVSEWTGLSSEGWRQLAKVFPALPPNPGRSAARARRRLIAFSTRALSSGRWRPLWSGAPLAKTPAIYVTAHIGSLLALRYILRSRGVAAATVIAPYNFDRADPAAKDAVFDRRFPLAFPHVLSSAGPQRLRTALRSGSVILAADLPQGPAFPARLLGAEVLLDPRPFRLARMTGVPCRPIFLTLPGRRWRITIGDALPAEEPAAQVAFARALEGSRTEGSVGPGWTGVLESLGPRRMSLTDQLADVARDHPRRPALSRGSERLSYAELAAAIDRRAEQMEGVRLVPLDGADALSFVVDFFAARLRGLPAVSHPPSTPSALREARERAILRAPASRTDRTVFYSSGSVGPSKAVPLSDANLSAAALAFTSWGEVRAQDRIAIGLSPAQIFGFVRGVLNALLLGAEATFFSPRRDPLAQAERLGATDLLLPTALLAVAARHRSRVSLSSLRCGGGLLRDADADAIEFVRGVPVRAGYGMTESSGLASRQRQDRPRRPRSSGPAAPGMEVSIVGEDDCVCGPGEAGEIRLGGAAVFGGYLSQDDPSPFDALGRLRTGDAGFLDESGELCVRGRLDFALRSGDRILCAEEVEAAIAEHPGVAEAAAVPLGRAFGVLVVLRDPSETLLEEIREHAENRLPGFARPRRVLGVLAIPRTASGKLDRLAASQWLSRTPSRG